MGICVVLSFCILLTMATAHVSDLPELIKDIIDQDGRPTQLTVFNNCWSFDRSKDLMRTLMVPMNFHDVKMDLTERVFDNKQHILAFIIDLNCSGSKEFLNTIPQKYFAHPYRWMIINEIGNDEHAFGTGFFMDKPVYVDNDIVLISSSADGFKLQQFYKLGSDSSSLIWENYGKWNSQNRLTDLRSSHVLAKRRSNLRQTPVVSSLVVRNEDTVNHLYDSRNRELDSITKYTFQIVDTLMSALNSSQTIRNAPIWGYLNQTTQKYSGMIGDLVDGSSDIGGTLSFITPNRLLVIDFLCTQTPTTVQFLFRQPALSTVSNIYILPFTKVVWWTITALIIVCTIVIFVTGIVTTRNSDENQVANRFTDFLLLSIGAVCQMGSDFKPKLLSSRISSLSLFVALLFFYTSYTANIVALLQSTTDNIRTLRDLLDSGFEFGLQDESYNRYYFKTETEPLRKQIYDTKIASTENFMNVSGGLEKMRNGLFAFHMELGPAFKYVEDHFFEHEKCGLTEIKFIQASDLCYVLQKRSSYKEIFRVNLIKLLENGLVDRAKKIFYPPKPKCNKNGQNFQSIGLADCHLIIMTILYGHLLAIVIFVIEKFMQARRLRRVCLI